ncbi:uncharacterized protein DFL_001541 [Arthrobotrys flagrans]|uniref:PD-(D/E)XK nuclease-like domain-containing protein n=1 Tax=Arthrobotrys flagrans TaxID=97331 RepID=A0A437A8P2_ARTFL|nr:hypothetical protein DFL_001541 [Arthrobotrys flagrans]
MTAEHEQKLEHSRVLDWILAAADNGHDPNQTGYEIAHTIHQPKAPATPSRALNRLRITDTPGSSHKRKRSTAGTGTTNADDEALVPKKQFRASKRTELDAGEHVYPADSVSQLDTNAPQSSRTNTYKTAASSGTPKSGKLGVLRQSSLNFTFLGVSGRAGLAANANKENVPADIQRTVHNLRVSFTPVGMMCSCIQGVITEQWPYEPWVGGTFSRKRCNNKRRHTQEVEFAIQITQRAENLQSKLTEETGWLTITQNILEFVSGPTQEYHPVTVEPVTTVDINRDMLPSANSVSTRLYSKFLATEPRREPRSIPSASPGLLPVRADIAVNVNLENSDIESTKKKITDTFGGYPMPFAGAAFSPILTISCKSQDGNGLEAELKSTLCASALLESWHRLGNPKSTTRDNGTPAARDPSSEGYPKRRRNITVDDVMAIQETGVDHIVTLQVLSYMWSFSVVFTDPAEPNDKNTPQSRTVLGPFHIGDIRTPTGVYAVLRFLDKLFKYKISVWLPGMLERDAA